MRETLLARLARFRSQISEATAVKSPEEVRRRTIYQSDTEKAFHGIFPQTWWKDGYGERGRKRGSNV